jgi:hypothetical protein
MTAETIEAAPVPVMVRRWRCPFCRQSRSAKKAAAAHVARCWRNPAARACFTCASLTQHPADYGRCFPGEPCDCGAPFDECAQGIDLDKEFPRVACPLWRALTREDGDGSPASLAATGRNWQKSDAAPGSEAAPASGEDGD